MMLFSHRISKLLQFGIYLARVGMDDYQQKKLFSSKVHLSEALDLYMNSW